MIGAEAAENPSRSGPIMTHLPPTVLQPVQECKYIYVTRNPYDCAVSFYHFIKGFTPKTVTGRVVREVSVHVPEGKGHLR
nr:sulfotransferase 1C3-like [Rhipicephalus microplus]